MLSLIFYPNRAVKPRLQPWGGSQLPELRIVGPAEPCDGRDGEWPVEWDGGHGLLVVRRLKAELKEIR